jgi:hypothetical protein
MRPPLVTDGVRSQLLTALAMQITVTPCTLVNRHRHFGRTCCPHIVFYSQDGGNILVLINSNTENHISVAKRAIFKNRLDCATNDCFQKRKCVKSKFPSPHCVLMHLSFFMNTTHKGAIVTEGKQQLASFCLALWPISLNSSHTWNKSPGLFLSKKMYLATFLILIVLLFVIKMHFG